MPGRKDPLLCKLPPQNIKAEETLIAAILIDNSTLDDMTFGFQNSDLIILAARPSMGKTAFALTLIKQIERTFAEKSDS
jgi:replicative DNA helicase